jgi:hypothetical protein
VSYDLVFWRQGDSERRSPSALYEAFLEERQVPGIPELPVEEFLARLVEAFPGAVREPNGASEWIDWSSTDGLSAFQIEWTPQHVRVTLRPLDEDRANGMIDIANDFGCALYDPQLDKRFVQPAPRGS